MRKEGWRRKRGTAAQTIGVVKTVLELTVYVTIWGLSFAVTGVAGVTAWVLIERSVHKHDGADPNQPSGEAPGLLRDEVLSTLSVFAVVLERFRFFKTLNRWLAEADIPWSVGRVVLMMLVAGAVSLNVLVRVDLIPTFGVWICAAAAASTPVWYVRSLRRRRLKQIEDQLPEALDFLSRALVAGHSLPMALELLLEEVDQPLAGELRKTVDEYNLGLSMNDAVQSLGDRLPSVDIEFFVSAIMTQSRTGGSLHELLDSLAETIRERQSLKGQIHALTANGRMTAVVLSLLPIFVAVVMMLVNRNYLSILINHPLGKILVFLAACGQVAAYFVIKKIADIKV